MTRGTVAVFGVSGRQGQAQVRRLVAEGHRVRAVTRTPGLFTDLEGVEVRPADYATRPLSRRC
ncbi:NmrA family NAD(P)-binding protein [Gordonia sp. McavH-238-E]|uniref:NmrA family NAD(P)-binding protein n=1 Tax=Gordonia sp. McavH-238-E TaxID=2917736 RepID=UPI0035ABB295